MGGANAGPPNNHNTPEIQHANKSRFCLLLRFPAHIYSVDVIHWSPIRCLPFLHFFLSLALFLYLDSLTCARSHTPLMRYVYILQSNKSAYEHTPHTHTHARSSQTTFMLRQTEWLNVSSCSVFTSALLRFASFFVYTQHQATNYFRGGFVVVHFSTIR